MKYRKKQQQVAINGGVRTGGHQSDQDPRPAVRNLELALMGRDAIVPMRLTTAAAPVARVSPYLRHDLLLKFRDG
jgi:hypothetical protein